MLNLDWKTLFSSGAFSRQQTDLLKRLLTTAHDAGPLAHDHPWGEITDTPTTLAGYGITDAAAAAHNHDAADINSGTFADARIPSLAASKITSGTFADARLAASNVTQHQAALAIAWSQITSKPTTLAGYGITDAASSGHTHTFASLTSKPTTLAGFGITDAALDSTVVHNTGVESIGGQKTFTSNVIMGNSTVAVQTYLRAGVGTVADLIYAEGGDNRWLFRKQALAANDLQFFSYDDAGVSALRATWNRSTGVLNFNQAPTYAGAAILNATDHPFSGNNVGSTLAQRSAAGDLVARLFRSEFANQTTISGAMAFRVNDSGDNYIRFCSDAAAIRTFLGAPALANSETFTGLKTFAPGGGGHPSLSSSFHSLIVGDRGTGDGLANLLLNPLGVDGGIGLRYSSSADTFSLNDWGSGSAPARWTMDRLTGNVTMTGGLGFGSAVAASVTDLSRHINLFGGGYGFSVTSNRLNYVATSTAAHEFYVGATSAFSFNGVSLYSNAKSFLRANDAWLRLNPDGDFTNGIYCGASLVRTDGAIQVGTTSANGFYASTTVAPRWKDIELGYRGVPQTITNAAYTYVADDAGKSRGKNTTTARAYTINTGVFAAGDVLTVFNHAASGNITITAGAGVTLYLAGTATTGNRTVGAYGLATVFFLTSSVALVSGPGVS